MINKDSEPNSHEPQRSDDFTDEPDLTVFETPPPRVGGWEVRSCGWQQGPGSTWGCSIVNAAIGTYEARVTRDMVLVTLSSKQARRIKIESTTKGLDAAVKRAVAGVTEQRPELFTSDEEKRAITRAVSKQLTTRMTATTRHRITRGDLR